MNNEKLRQEVLTILFSVSSDEVKADELMTIMQEQYTQGELKSQKELQGMFSKISKMFGLPPV